MTITTKKPPFPHKNTHTPLHEYHVLRPLQPSIIIFIFHMRSDLHSVMSTEINWQTWNGLQPITKGSSAPSESRQYIRPKKDHLQGLIWSLRKRCNKWNATCMYTCRNRCSIYPHLSQKWCFGELITTSGDCTKSAIIRRFEGNK